MKFSQLNSVKLKKGKLGYSNAVIYIFFVIPLQHPIQNNISKLFFMFFTLQFKI